MKSRLPRAAHAEPLAARVSYLIIWTCTTGALATPCLLLRPSLLGTRLFWARKRQPKMGKAQVGRSRDLEVGQEGSGPEDGLAAGHVPS